jgi:hypothetical protein
MRAMPKFIHRPGVYHAMGLNAPHTPEQERWFEQTCTDVEAFARVQTLGKHMLPLISLAIHVTADHLFVRHGGEASWEKLEPGELASNLSSMTYAVTDYAVLLGMVAAFYLYLGESQRIDLLVEAQVVQQLLAYSQAALGERMARDWRADRRIKPNPVRRPRPC